MYTLLDYQWFCFHNREKNRSEKIFLDIFFMVLAELGKNMERQDNSLQKFIISLESLQKLI